MAGKQNLSPKEIAACEAYLKGSSLRKALLAAGYSPNYCEGNAHLFNWLKRRHICGYIRHRQQMIAEANATDVAFCIKVAKDIITDNDPKDRAKALELLNRMVVPLPDAPTKDDIKSININIETATKE